MNMDQSRQPEELNAVDLTQKLGRLERKISILQNNQQWTLKEIGRMETMINRLLDKFNLPKEPIVSRPPMQEADDEDDE